MGEIPADNDEEDLKHRALLSLVICGDVAAEKILFSSVKPDARRGAQTILFKRGKREALCRQETLCECAEEYLKMKWAKFDPAKYATVRKWAYAVGCEYINKVTENKTGRSPLTEMQMDKVKDALDKLGPNASVPEIMAATGLSRRKVINARSFIHHSEESYAENLQDQSHHMGADRIQEAMELSEKLEKGLAKLSRPHQIIVSMRFWEDASYPEIAEALGLITPNSSPEDIKTMTAYVYNQNRAIFKQLRKQPDLVDYAICYIKTFKHHKKEP